MPGLILFGRRWSVGSDDLVVPGAFLCLTHLIWSIILCLVLFFPQWNQTFKCVLLLYYFIIGHLALSLIVMVIEFAICHISTRGSILDTAARASLKYFLYTRLVLLLLEAAWLTADVFWLKNYYQTCPVSEAKDIVLGLLISNGCVLATIVITIWCVYDSAGGSWVKMKNYQRSMREAETRGRIQKRSGSRHRNWRQRKVMRAYQDSWDSRCRMLFCCIRKSDRNRNSFADIARLLSEFFRDLDVVPTDVVAGLVLLRKFQKIERELIIKQRKNDTYDFLSGVPVTPRTKFLKLTEDDDLEHFQNAIHYMHFALAAYGWPLFLLNHSTGLCQLCKRSRCQCITRNSSDDNTTIIEDNFCQCNYTALKQMLQLEKVEVVYASFHVDVGETPFFVAIDHSKKKVVVSIRGTLSMKDVMTDLNAESEVIPVTPPRDDWFGHKGMVQAAVYIKKKLLEDGILSKAQKYCPSACSSNFGITLVGHSLGAGTAAILAILLKEKYPDINCFAYAPPGGLLSMPAQKYTEKFITSVVLGKDVVPRIGLRQMESLRADLINAIKRSVDPKWKTITCSMMCCGCGTIPTSAANLETGDSINAYQREKDLARSQAVVPEDTNTALTLHRHLYPPGRIIHVVRRHLQKDEQKLNKYELVYQALWADPQDFDEVLISPVMIQDHMPDNMLEALNKVVATFGPEKPKRLATNQPATCSCAGSFNSQTSQDWRSVNPGVRKKKLCLETSFTSLQSPMIDQYPPNGGELSVDSRIWPWEYVSSMCSQVHNSSSRNMSSNKSMIYAADQVSICRRAPLATPETLSDISSCCSSPVPCPQTNNKSPIIGNNINDKNYKFPRGPPPPVPRRRDSVHLFVDQRICKDICCTVATADDSFYQNQSVTRALNNYCRDLMSSESDKPRSINGRVIDMKLGKQSNFIDLNVKYKHLGDASLPLIADLFANSDHHENSGLFEKKKSVYPNALVSQKESSV